MGTVFLQTERLILRYADLSDLDDLAALRANPTVMKYIGKPQTREEVHAFLTNAILYQEKHRIGFFSVFEKESGDFIGQAGLFHVGFYDEQPEIEIGYRLHPHYWGKGFATELTRALIQWGFEHLSVEKLVGIVHPDNHASHRVLQKCGLDYRGICPSYYGPMPKYEIYKNEAIELVPYNPEWPTLAALEIQQLRTTLPSEHVLGIQHVGSTAIPSIQAKPVIDLQIAVDSLPAIKPIAIERLEKLGYQYWAENPDPERLFFVKGMPPFGEKRTHHVHILEPASKHWQGKIQFRDYLLAHPEAASAYEQLKLNLMQRYRYDREQYTEQKTAFVQDILQKASRENPSVPLVIFLTGASGAGKTTLIRALEQSPHDSTTVFLHFDDIGVPSVEEMDRVYGSGAEWQKAMMYHWAKQIIDKYAHKKYVILEGQVNLDFIESALKGFNLSRYQIILLHCQSSVRHKRLFVERNQAELVNDTMDSWADFLKNQALSKNASILDTSDMKEEQMVAAFEKQVMR